MQYSYDKAVFEKKASSFFKDAVYSDAGYCVTLPGPCGIAVEVMWGESFLDSRFTAVDNDCETYTRVKIDDQIYEDICLGSHATIGAGIYIIAPETEQVVWLQTADGELHDLEKGYAARIAKGDIIYIGGGPDSDMDFCFQYVCE